MFNISKKELKERWDAMSQNLKEALYSEYNFDVLADICKKEHLSEEKISIVATLTGDVIMGFLLAEDLGKEITRELDINPVITNNIAQEINRKIFEPIKNEIRKIYEPPTETGDSTEIKKPGVISLEKLSEKEHKEQKVRIETKVAPSHLDAQERIEVGQPLILHKEKSTNEERGLSADRQQKPFKGFDFPFGFMKPKTENRISSPVKVTIETPQDASLDAPPSPRLRRAKEEKEKKRIVHYSELRTPISPFGKPEKDIINLNKPEESKAQQLPEKALLEREEKKPILTTSPQIETPGIKAPKNKKPEPSQPKTQESKLKPPIPKKPSIEGNIIDLRH